MRDPNDQVVRSLVVGAPLGALLGMEIESIEPDRVRVRLPFRTEITTLGEVVHGGALAALVDTAATAAAWAGADLAGSPRGTTVALTINFLAAARGVDVIADAQVIRRGRTLTVCEVRVESAPGPLVAVGHVTYKLG